MRRTAGWHRSFAGILVVLLGVGFLLQNLTDFKIDWGVVWPVVLILLGVVNLPSARWLGVLLVVVGAVFLVDNLDVIDVDIGDFWPVVLVVVGLLILFGGRARWRRREPRPSGPAGASSADEASTADVLDAAGLFGEVKRQVTSRNFQGGKVSATFGSAEIDLRGAALAGDGATIHVEAVFGSAELLAPADWAVNVQASELFGSVEVKRQQPSSPAGTLTLTGSCTFGSITVR